MRRIAIIPIIVGVALLLVTPPVAHAEPLAVIVHPGRDAPLGLDDLARIYLKKRLFWDDGESIIPLNREPGSPARETFSSRVLGSDSGHLASYWNEHYFQGIFPPTTLASDAAVKRYVAAERNAIGYIGVHEVDDSVRVVLKLE